MTFANTYELSEAYRDRHGCGDELFLDSRFRSETLLAELTSGVDRTHEVDTSEDDVATH
jgi:hypothetical protein